MPIHRLSTTRRTNTTLREESEHREYLIPGPIDPRHQTEEQRVAGINHRDSQYGLLENSTLEEPRVRGVRGFWAWVIGKLRLRKHKFKRFSTAVSNSHESSGDAQEVIESAQETAERAQGTAERAQETAENAQEATATASAESCNRRSSESETSQDEGLTVNLSWNREPEPERTEENSPSPTRSVSKPIHITSIC